MFSKSINTSLRSKLSWFILQTHSHLLKWKIVFTLSTGRFDWHLLDLLDRWNITFLGTLTLSISYAVPPPHNPLSSISLSLFSFFPFLLPSPYLFSVYGASFTPLCHNMGSICTNIQWNSPICKLPFRCKILICPTKHDFFIGCIWCSVMLLLDYLTQSIVITWKLKKKSMKIFLSYLLCTMWGTWKKYLQNYLSTLAVNTVALHI